MTKRQVTEWSEREFVRNRYNIWFGADKPKTISAKEIVDNGIDQIADGLATKVRVDITKNSIAVLDNGKGISTRKSSSGKTHLFLAVNKLYTSSNYGGTEGLAGTNGVGATATNALSEKFFAGYINEDGFLGYEFEEGVHKNEGENLDKISDLSKLKMKNLDSGFYVEARYSSNILEDDIDIDWLISYIEGRVGELKEGSIVSVSYPEEKQIEGSSDTEISENTLEFNRVKGSKNYIKSWEERVEEVPTAKIIDLRGGWRFAFCEDSKGRNFDSVRSIVQGAAVENGRTSRIMFEIEDTSVGVSVPVTFYYKGKGNPAYTDQTKSRIRMQRGMYLRALKSDKDLYSSYRLKAEEQYLSSMFKDSKSSMYYPASGNKGYKELIISEGFSAALSIKNKRSYKTQACFALRGKVLNVMQKDIKSAMRSDVVRDLIKVLTNDEFDKIVITPDADPDGAHICTLLLGVLVRFGRKYLEEGKVYYCKTPLYVFEKGKDMKWSDDVSDRPKGYSLDVKKGLGSLTAEQVKAFITDPDTRELFKFEAPGKEDLDALEFALVSGGKNWIKH